MVIAGGFHHGIRVAGHQIIDRFGPIVGGVQRDRITNVLRISSTNCLALQLHRHEIVGMLVVAVRPLLGDVDLAKLHLHHRMRIYSFGRFAGCHVVDLGEHAIVQLRIRVGIVASLPSGYVSGIRVSRIRIVVAARIVGICSIAWLDFKGNVDDISLFYDDAISTVERHRHRTTVGIVCGRISALQRGIAVLHRHILCDVGTVGGTCELDRIHPLGQGVGDGEDLDLRRRSNAGIDLIECFRQIRRIRAVEFHAIHRIGLTRKIIHLIGVGSGLHHVQGGVAAIFGFSQRGRVIKAILVAASCAIYATGTAVRVLPPTVSVRLAIRFGRIFRMCGIAPEK